MEGSLIFRAGRAAIRLLERELRERRVTDSYRTAYTATPLTEEEARVLDAAIARACDADA